MERLGGGQPRRPQTVKELVAQAENFSFNVNIPLKHWIRAAETLYQEASFALSDGDFGRAYVMLYRHSVLVITFLRTHPEFKNPEGRKSVRPLLDRIDRIIQDLEQLKPEIENQYKEWERTASKEVAATKDASIQSANINSYQGFAARDPSLTGNARILDASEHQELAVDLAQEELSRRDTLRKTGRRDIPTTIRAEDSDLQRQLEATRVQLDRNQKSQSDARQHDLQQLPTTHYNYPSISKSSPVSLDPRGDAPPERPYKPDIVAQPVRPPKEYSSISPNEQPQNQAVSAFDRPLLPPKTTYSAPSLPKKERLTFKPGAYLENGDPIRSLFIPSKLRQSFLDVASKNTAAGLEMCGVLCGTPVNNALFVRCLLIPDQKCTSDTCETENEAAMVDYCLSEDLMILGWIHTHPTQTCFMSSRDLHTHAGYQVMMPESVAIVCAPKFNPSYGIFRLTSPPGLGHILDCKQSGLFHPHSITNLYLEAEHPQGHVYESDKMPFYIHDLRSQ